MRAELTAVEGPDPAELERQPLPLKVPGDEDDGGVVAVDVVNPCTCTG